MVDTESPPGAAARRLLSDLDERAVRELREARTGIEWGLCLSRAASISDDELSFHELAGRLPALLECSAEALRERLLDLAADSLADGLMAAERLREDRRFAVALRDVLAIRGDLADMAASRGPAAASEAARIARVETRRLQLGQLGAE